MDSNTFNWIAMAALSALLLLFGTPVLIELMHGGGHGGDHAKAGYKLPDAAASSEQAGGGAHQAAAAFDFKKVAALFGGASADTGKAVFKKCAACHTVSEGGNNGQGPNLWGIVGRNLGSADGFKYSKALTEKAGAWDYARLAEFLHKPKDYIKGTKMAFAGLGSEKDLANLLAYLQSLSASPKPFPKAEWSNDRGVECACRSTLSFRNVLPANLLAGCFAFITGVLQSRRTRRRLNQEH